MQGVQDQVKAGLELVGVLVARLNNVRDGDLGEIGILPGLELPEDVACDLGGLLAGAEREARLLQREPVDVAVEQRVGVGGQFEREACPAQTAKHRVVVPQRGRARCPPPQVRR